MVRFVPDKTFKKKLRINADASPDNGEVLYVAEIGYMEIGVFRAGVNLYRQRISGFTTENEVNLDFCDSISSMIKSPTLLQTGWLTFVTPAYGVNHADLGTPVTRGEMDLARYVASDVESRSREARRSGVC